MTRAKSELFERSLVRPAATAKALSHPVRIKILKILAERDACICGEIVDRLPLSQSTVSQHLKELKKAGLIKGTIPVCRKKWGAKNKRPCQTRRTTGFFPARSRS